MGRAVPPGARRPPAGAAGRADAPLSSPDAVREALRQSPALFPIQLDLERGAVRLLRLSEADYVRASFLDERLLTSSATTSWATAADVATASAALPLGSDFIFHIGHVGSTLLARLLGVSPQVFAVREPAPLRRLASDEAAADAWLDPLMRLYGRTWRPGQRSLVKATSFVADIAPRLLGADASARALLMAASPPVHMAGLLGGEATRAELPRLTEGRLARLATRSGGRAVAPVRSLGEMAAAAWACEACALVACAEAFPGRVLWLDFDRFLMDPRDQLAACLVHLRGEVDEMALGDMLASPDMYRYSKAPEHAFSAGQRGQILRQASQEYAAEIARGLAWLDQMTRSYPPIAAARTAASRAAAR